MGVEGAVIPEGALVSAPDAASLPLALLHAPSKMRIEATAEQRLANKRFDTTRIPEPPDAFTLGHG